MNAFALKWIAILTMAVDHIGAVLYPDAVWLRVIGRLSFPLFCFVLVEGFFHTSHLPRYLGRLGVFALLAEVPYDLALTHRYFDPDKQNVLFTFLIALGMLAVLIRVRPGTQPLVVVLAMGLSWLLRTDYSYAGILLVTFLYYFHHSRTKASLSVAVWSALTLPSIQAFSGLAAILIYFYNGRRGPGLKYFFYVFYPAHLLLLYFILQLKEHLV